nr:uncharacterized protein LOC123747860 [Procambarus clarkii]
MDNDTAALQLQVLSQFPNLTLEDVMKILFFMESNVTVGSVTLTNVTFANATQHYCQFNFRERYKWVHFRLAVCIAVTGVLTNLLTVSTLTRRTMTTPTNLLLLGLAVADLLVEVEYIPYATSTLVGGDQLMQAKEHALYVLIHAHLSHVCHTIAIWLTVTLAVWRWVAVCRPHSAPTLCTMVYARRVLLAVYLACPALATPTFLMYTVNEYPDDAGSKVYRVEFSSFALAHNELLKKINLLVYSVLVKLVPCLLLAVLMPAIIRGMWMAKRRRQRLQECRRPSGVVPAADGGGKVHADPPSANTLLAKTERRLSRSSCGSNKPSAKKPVAVANGTDHPKPHSNRENEIIYGNRRSLFSTRRCSALGAVQHSALFSTRRCSALGAVQHSALFSTRRCSVLGAVQHSALFSTRRCSVLGAVQHSALFSTRRCSALGAVQHSALFSTRRCSALGAVQHSALFSTRRCSALGAVQYSALFSTRRCSALGAVQHSALFSTRRCSALGAVQHSALFSTRRCSALGAVQHSALFSTRRCSALGAVQHSALFSTRRCSALGAVQHSALFANNKHKTLQNWRQITKNTVNHINTNGDDVCCQTKTINAAVMNYIELSVKRL